ncbi:MAG: hypothetical protein AAGH65_01100 [Pseudomonadota bacterium]
MLTQDDSSEANTLLQQAVDAELPQAMVLRALELGLDETDSQRLMYEAFQQGAPDAQFFVGISLNNGTERGAFLMFELLRRAALGGHILSMRILGDFALNAEPPEQDLEAARQWFASGLMFGDIESGANLAALIELHPELNPEFEDPAMTMAMDFYTEAGAEAAMTVPTVMIEGEYFAPHSDRGFALLQRMSDEGIAEASLDLGERYRFGSGVPVDTEAAAEWFQRAFEQGSLEAKYEHAGLLVFDLDRPQEGLAMFQSAADQGHVWASNDLAWLLCTGESNVARNPHKGLSVIDQLVGQTDAPHAYLYSTLAACQAALGKYEQAQSNQSIALNRTLEDEPEATDVHAQMQERMALYQAHQPYIWQAEDQ